MFLLTTVELWNIPLNSHWEMLKFVKIEKKMITLNLCDCGRESGKCKSIGGEWMHESGNQNDLAFCKEKGTEFDKQFGKNV